MNKHRNPHTNQLDFELAVVGGGLTSARAIRSYREAGGDGRIALFSRDTMLPYHRPPLSKRYLRGESELDGALVEPASFYDEHGVEVFLGTTVAAVDAVERTLTLADGAGRVRFEKLLVATGAEPRRPTGPGSNLPGIYALRTAADAAAIRASALAGGRAVVLGGGFVGMEVAASLRSLGLDVALVNRTNGVFDALGAPQLSRELIELYASHGVELVLPGEVTGFSGSSRVEAVELAGGGSLPADLVVAGLGVVPATRFLEGSGLELDDGVVVDDRFATSAPGVYAAGDVARFWDPLYGRRRRIEHWSNASYQGTQVGAVLAGTDAPYDTLSSFFTEVFGVTVRVWGETRAERFELSGSLASGLLGLYFDGDRLVGALAVGQDDDTQARVQEAIVSGGFFAGAAGALERVAA